MITLVVFLAGGLGAGLRYLFDVGIHGLRGRPTTLGTSLVNIFGSVALGLFLGLSFAGETSSFARAVTMTGLCGGLTTWSTASVETLRLLRSRGPWWAVLQTCGTFAVALAAAAIAANATA